MNRWSRYDRMRRIAAMYFLVCGWIGILAGAIPFAANLVWLTIGPHVAHLPDLARHGPESMGLSVEWALLSSAEGFFLGALLVVSGFGWLRNRSWAATVTLLYGLNGVLVTGCDLVIFAWKARPGTLRTLMMAADGIAFGVACSALAWLVIRRLLLGGAGTADA